MTQTQSAATHAARTLPVSDAAPLDLHRAYTAEQAARFLGLTVAAVFSVPADELPRCRVGEYRTAIRFNGLDLLCYLHGLQPVDWAAVRDAAVRQAAPDLTSVLPLRRAV